MIKSRFPILNLILLFYPVLVMGQVSLGAFVGLNSSKLAGDTPPDGIYGTKMGANLGILMDMKLGKAVTLSLQPSYSQEGTKLAYNVKGINEPVDSARIHLNYFSLPLLLKVTSNNERFYALSGFEAGMLLNHGVTIAEETDELESEIARWNLAMHFGAGIRIPVGFPCLFFELRYAQGLVNLTDDPLSKDIIPRVKTSGFKLLCGIEFPLSKSKN